MSAQATDPAPIRSQSYFCIDNNQFAHLRVKLLLHMGTTTDKKTSMESCLPGFVRDPVRCSIGQCPTEYPVKKGKEQRRKQGTVRTK